MVDRKRSGKFLLMLQYFSTNAPSLDVPYIPIAEYKGVQSVIEEYGGRI